jgi:hypothetical protein
MRILRTTKTDEDQVTTLKRLITARRISLGLILLIAGLIYVSTLIPQEIDAPPGKIETWRLAHPGLLPLVDGAHLHRIHGQPWFAAAILLSALAMGISSFDQLKLARKRLCSAGSTTGEEVARAAGEQLLRTVAVTHGYRPIHHTTGGDRLKFVKNPWGYFGSLLLHLGMTLVIVASLYVSLTGRQGALIMVEGEQRTRQEPWDITEHGAFSAPLELPGTIRLDRVRVRYDDKNQPEEVSSDLTFSDAAGRIEAVTASINRIPDYRGLRIYHASQYGSAFTVEFTDNLGTTHSERILAQQPADLTTAGYSEDFGVAWSPYLFSAKYYADAGRKTTVGTTPQLTIRMLDGKREIGRTVVPPGRAIPLGGYMVRLVSTEKWAKLIIVDNSGMPMVFAGFAIIMLGGLLHYLLPPRELIGTLRQAGTYRVIWNAPNFADFFAEEREMIATKLREERT